MTHDIVEYNPPLEFTKDNGRVTHFIDSKHTFIDEFGIEKENVYTGYVVEKLDRGIQED